MTRTKLETELGKVRYFLDTERLTAKANVDRTRITEINRIEKVFSALVPTWDEVRSAPPASRGGNR